MTHDVATRITHETVQAWLDAYERAWESYEPEQIAALFSQDAEYRWHPAEEPVVGRDEIVRAWVAPDGNESSRDAAGTYLGEYRPYAVDGHRAVAIGTSTYWTDASRSKVERIYYNNWLLEFDDDGRCRSFTEYWMEPRKS
jgi:nuclear transport factor 2 (NTF2) superfamily protein